MKLTTFDKKILERAAAEQAPKESRPREPEGYRGLGRKYGVAWWNLRNRMQRGMTLEEAIKAPVLTRQECGKASAKARWGDKSEGGES